MARTFPVSEEKEGTEVEVEAPKPSKPGQICKFVADGVYVYVDVDAEGNEIKA